MNKTALFLSAALAPFGAALILFLARPLVNLIRRKMPDGRIKRLLLWRYS